ncbi:MAG: coproporphyrinogen dehydrogenase HemZ [Oscillospiraceae bacterium]|jgi:oxygen-independent coproporphyrinogen-3 oxidase|nr:coproporphyrinogen dehydrogenase HemZ [Oscillospiraceae bacterium]
MRLTLGGEAKKAAAEQAALNFFPPEADAEVYSCLRVSARYMTATARIRLGRKTSSGMARAASDSGSGDYCVKESIYRAAVPLLGGVPPWGSLTGIRPAKLALNMLDGGLSMRGADRELGERYHVTPERRALALECAQAAARARPAPGTREIALYVGIPFCPTRCAYCSFVSRDVGRSGALIGPFLSLLLREIALAGETVRALNLRPAALYIGGGTPTALSADDLRRVMAALWAAFPLGDCAEITVEAGRPDTFTREKIAVLRQNRVNRISVNPQTMRDDVLRAIGRPHSVSQSRAAFSLARRAGFETINADLIAGLPGDGEKGFARSVDALIKLKPENVTIHTLALKKGAAFWEEAAARPDGAEVGRMLGCAAKALRGAGYAPYYLYRQKFMSGGFENVGWTLPGHANRYNLFMMEELGTVLAMGGGGVTKCVLPGGRIQRLANCKFPLEYIQSYDKIENNLRAFSKLMTGENE